MRLDLLSPRSFPVLLLFQWLFITYILDPRHIWYLTEQFQDPCQVKFPAYLPLLLQVSGLKFLTGSMFLSAGFYFRIFSFRSFFDKKRSKFSLRYLAISPGILYWNFLSYDLKSTGRWSIDWSQWSRSAWRRRIWWTRRGIMAPMFLVLVMLTFWISFAGWLWSTWRWWWWAASCPSSFITWKGFVKGQSPHFPLIVTWQRLPLQGPNISFSHYYFLLLFGTNNRDLK